MERIVLNTNGEIASPLGRINHLISIDPRGCAGRETAILDVQGRVLSPPVADGRWRLCVMPAIIWTNYASFGTACASAACLRVSSAFRNSRERFRRSIFCFRNRPNLDLSPFLSDIIASFMSPGWDSSTARGSSISPQGVESHGLESRHLFP